MSKPELVQAWQCGLCPHTYPNSDVGRKMAEACCTCKKCGAEGTLYTGQGMNCPKCAAEEEVVSAREGLERAEARLSRAEREFGRLSGPVP
jgi:Zn finger protein HypA/HybF involved in hydrogenase expression